MSAQEPTNNQLAEETPANKGKGVAETSVEDSAMDEDDSSSSDEEETPAIEEKDGLEEIDLNNIVEGGRRTRGRVIDWAKAAEENPAQDDEDDDDEDFHAPEDTDSKMDTD
ncbi:predicted protein [Verticillium alfalfae VaMs.102]|uniref:Predicted protein n=1 Tax=Verticillium alfalfae (strain VaMs.102 / ATCC MYA-4576 / FGSC 10136) TaxID=526221 RepID=C9SQB3_VERA1|nr:predicted protein [Verticillium alfalfae VaMs.102]EEY21038.1 predicted protein [Verticillium alfalfae VaMs.102]